MLERFNELRELFQELSADQGFLVALSAFSGGVSRIIIKSLRGTSASSFWQILGMLFVATVVGILVAVIAERYVLSFPELLFGVAFAGGYLWKKLLDKLDAIDLACIIQHIKGKK